MAKFQVRILQAASRDLERLDPPVARRIVRRIQWLAENLESTRLEPLSGDLTGFYKLRVGDYRVIYEILWEEKVILIHLIGHRREIYRKR